MNYYIQGEIFLKSICVNVATLTPRVPGGAVISIV